MTKFDSNTFYGNCLNNGFFMGYYNHRNLPKSPTDYYYIIPTKYDLKPGLLAYDLYGDAQLLWVFSIFNRDILQDPLFDFRAGKIIRIPTKDRLEEIL